MGGSLTTPQRAGLVSTDEFDPSFFKPLNLLRRRMFPFHKHVLEQITFAQKDSEGTVSWVEFTPSFYSHLVRSCYVLLDQKFTASAQAILKRAPFVLILELLNQEYFDVFFELRADSAKEKLLNREKKWLARKRVREERKMPVLSRSDPATSGSTEPKRGKR